MNMMKDNLKLVEDFIKKLDNPTTKELWNSLNKKVSYDDLSIILKDLEQSGKIMIDDTGRIIWTWNPEMIKKIMASGVKLR